MIYFTSDTHYFHVRALELMPNRKYETLDMMILSYFSVMLLWARSLIMFL